MQKKEKSHVRKSFAASLLRPSRLFLAPIAIKSFTFVNLSVLCGESPSHRSPRLCDESSNHQSAIKYLKSLQSAFISENLRLTFFSG
jgi:hypothetical protein